ncbi:MAG: VOC family protein [Bacteroidetes bacterium]|nr:VOC family protein [Bacteroidota bacterium]MBI3482535.1 VOC family protein [Bacteroidota bacterium]
MTHILGGNVTVMVSDMDTAVKFYTETLGLKLRNRYGDHWADVDGPGISLGLHPAGKDVKIGNNLQIGFKVDDLDKAVADLERKNVKFTTQDDTQVRLAIFADPDGNALYLAQSKW